MYSSSIPEKSVGFIRGALASAILSCIVLLAPAAWTVEATPTPAEIEARDQLIRDRMRDYEAKLKTDYEQKIREWSDSFITSRADRIAAATDDFIKSYDTIKKHAGKDADAMKNDPEFKKAISEKIVAILDADGIKDGLKGWAVKVETQTRSRLIECFQQIVADDMGRVFDQNLRDKVVAAVKAIPVDDLVNNKKSVDEIQGEILKALPDSALNDQVRGQIKAVAVILTQFGVYAVGVKTGQIELAKVVAPIAGQVVAFAAEAQLKKLNEHLTKKPDANLVRDAFADALADWNKSKLEPSLATILQSFGDESSKKVEDEARKLNYSRPK